MKSIYKVQLGKTIAHLEDADMVLILRDFVSCLTSWKDFKVSKEKKLKGTIIYTPWQAYLKFNPFLKFNSLAKGKK